MKRKSSNTGAGKEFVKQIASNLNIIIGPKITKIRGYLNSRPKTTVFVMTLILLTNFFIFLAVNKKSKSAYDITDIYTGRIIKDQFPTVSNPVPFTISNYFKMTAIKDSLEAIMHKKNPAPEDTLALLRLFDKYAELDTTFKPILK